jgi:hypothetical protein
LALLFEIDDKVIEDGRETARRTLLQSP